MSDKQPCHELELVDRLTELQRNKQELQLFGLIDGTLDSETLAQFFLLAPESDYAPLFLDTEYAACLPRSPYLIALAPDNTGFLTEYGCWCESRIVWYLSSQPLKLQVAHWRSLIQAITPDESIALFRFWNARILEPYLDACDAVERSQLLTPCHTLFVPGSQRKWSHWQGGERCPEDRLADSPWWHIRPQHLRGFTDAFERLLVDAIEDTLWRTESASLQGIYPPLLPQLIGQGIQQARKLGLPGDQALTQFVRCQMRFGLEYWRAPTLAPLWNSPAGGEQAFLDWAQLQLQRPGIAEA